MTVDEVLREYVAMIVKESRSAIAAAVTPHVMRSLRTWEDSGWDDEEEMRTNDVLLNLGLGESNVVKVMTTWRSLRSNRSIDAIGRVRSLIDAAMRVRYLASMEDLVRRLVREIVKEVMDNPRVPSQLVSKDSDDDDDDEVDEAMTTASIVGYTLPLGMGGKGDPKKRMRWK